jgi:hypothetical protein
MGHTLAEFSARTPPAQQGRDDFVTNFEIVIVWDSKVSVAAETTNAKRKNTFGQPLVRRVSCREQQLQFCTARRWLTSCPSIAQRIDCALICRMSERAHEILFISAFMSLAMILILSLAQDRLSDDTANDS